MRGRYVLKLGIVVVNPPVLQTKPMSLKGRPEPKIHCVACKLSSMLGGTTLAVLRLLSALLKTLPLKGRRLLSPMFSSLQFPGSAVFFFLRPLLAAALAVPTEPGSCTGIVPNP